MKKIIIGLFHFNTSPRLVVLKRFTVLVAILCMLSCDDFVEVDLPHSQLTATAVFEDEFTATAALVDIYSKMRNEGVLSGSTTGVSLLMGNYADELDFYGNPQAAAVPFYNNSLTATNRDVKNFWDNSYKQIYAANAIIEGVENSSTLPQTTRDLLKGEALFIRSLLHFYLTNLYGDLPYVTSTDYLQNKEISRLPVTMVYLNIKNDLDTAISLLPEAYVTPDRARPNKFAAMALLARVNLYAGLWEEASAVATEVINQTHLYALETIENSFFINSTNTIWQFMSSVPGNNTTEASTFIFNTGPPPASALRADLINTFESGDLRKEHWTRAVSNASGTWYHSFKYKSNSNTGSSQEYSKVFRLAEIYLIRAEARARQADLISAKQDLNLIRSRSGLEATTANSQEEVIKALVLERRVELFTEFGHRFFDLKRLNLLDETLQPIKMGWNSTDAFFPIPESEMLLNENLAPQNPGY